MRKIQRPTGTCHMKEDFTSYPDKMEGGVFLTLPLSKTGRLERHLSACKEKTLLILVSSVLISLTSISACLFIVQTLITIPSYDQVKESISV